MLWQEKSEKIEISIEIRKIIVVESISYHIFVFIVQKQLAALFMRKCFRLNAVKHQHAHSFTYSLTHRLRDAELW